MVMVPTPMEEPKTRSAAGIQEAEAQYITRAEALAMREDLLKQIRTYCDHGRARAEAEIRALAEEVQTIREAMLQLIHE